MTNTKAISALLVGVLALAVPSAASAVDFFLIAKEFDKTLPDGNVVKMWGFASDPGGACWSTVSGGVNSAASKAARMAAAACTAPVASSPGPQLVAPPTNGVVGNDRVRIRLVNLLDSTQGGEPISLIIPGQAMPDRTNPGPTWTDGSVGPNAGGVSGVRRVRSFGRESSANGGRRSYNWLASNGLIRDGSTLYHSGTHPQVQVQMGLYGAITRDSAAGVAYGGANPVSFDHETTVIYSEIDPALHAAVTTNDYGPGTGMTSTIGYLPTYFLVNGESFTSKAAATIAGAAVVGDRTLLRLLNAGYQTHTAVLQGIRMSIVAEDGHQYPQAREEASAVLPPLKALDVILAPTVGGTFALYDGMLSLTNADGTVGGMLSFINVAGGIPPVNHAPVAVDDPALAGAYDVNKNNVLTVAGPGVLGNDSDPDNHPLSAVLGATNVANGALALNSDGSFVYTPNLNFAGTDTFTYKASDGLLESPEATATINVVFIVNNAPVADDQAIATGQQLIGGLGETVAVTLTGSDLDGDSPLIYTVTGGPSNGFLFGVAPDLFYTPNIFFAGTDSFTFKINDGTDDSVVDGTVTVTVAENQPPVADDDTADTLRNNAVTFSLIGNDVDADGSIMVTTIVVTDQPKNGVLVNNGNGTMTYTPNFDYKGSDSFRYRVRDDDGALSVNPNGGLKTKVRVNTR